MTRNAEAEVEAVADAVADADAGAEEEGRVTTTRKLRTFTVVEIQTK